MQKFFFERFNQFGNSEVQETAGGTTKAVNITII